MAGPPQAPTTSSAGCCFSSAPLNDAGAARVTAVAPYLGYARKDRRTKPGDPVTTRCVASLFEAVAAALPIAGPREDRQPPCTHRRRACGSTRVRRGKPLRAAQGSKN
jgi:N-terminal domain of ribose phosphate pyrophosphokinase